MSMSNIEIALALTLILQLGACSESTFAQAEKPKLPQPSAEICTPRPAPPATPTPVPPPGTPTKPPTPPPAKLPKPTPPADLEVEGPDLEKTGIALIDAAVAGKYPRSVLPLWHGYPYFKVTTPNAYTAHIAQVLRTQGQDLLNSNPADIAWHCPKYAQMDAEQRLVFWIRFLSILAEAESSMNPVACTRDTSVGSNVFSTGLLMISFDSAKQEKWGCTMIETQDDLFRWRKNTTCAIRIMNLLMKEDGALSYNPNHPVKKPYYGIGRYWGPLRDGRIKADDRRFCIDEVIKLRRPDWVKASKSKQHVSHSHSDLRKAGETHFEKFLRVQNMYPFCN